jgi:nitrous oxidase accessory protein
MQKNLWKKGLVIGTIVFLSCTCLIPLESGIIMQSSAQNFNNMNNIKNSITKIIIVPDDYPTIQAAINHASYNDTIQVKAGIYKQNIVVNKTVTIKGDGFSSTIIDGNGTGNTITITADHVEISGFTIRGGGGAGICIPSYSNVIQMNNITGNENGVVIVSSIGNQVLDNWIVGNTYMGVSMESSHSNNITGNTISKNGGNGCIVNKTSTDNFIAGNIAYQNGLKALTLGQNTGLLGPALVINNKSQYNIITGNDITNNAVGIKGMGASDSNTFQLNDLTGNYNQNANDSSNNIWSQSNTGNHWGDYKGNDSNHDGIGDTPYKIPGGGNKDSNPIMYTLSPSTPVVTCPISPVKSGQPVTIKIKTPIPNPKYPNVYYEVYWGDNGRWERTNKTVNPATITNITHIWNLPKSTHGATNKTFSIIVRAVIINKTISTKPIPIYSNESAACTIIVPYSFDLQLPTFFNLLFQRFPHAFPILRHVLGY